MLISLLLLPIMITFAPTSTNNDNDNNVNTKIIKIQIVIIVNRVSDIIKHAHIFLLLFFFRRSITSEAIQASLCNEVSLENVYQEEEDSPTRKDDKIDNLPTTSRIITEVTDSNPDLKSEKGSKGTTQVSEPTYEKVKQKESLKHDYQEGKDQSTRKENEAQNTPTTLNLNKYMYEGDSSSETDSVTESDITEIPSFMGSDERKGAQSDEHEYEKLKTRTDSSYIGAPLPVPASDRNGRKKTKTEGKSTTAGETSKSVQDVKTIVKENPKNKRKNRLEIPHKYERVQHKKDVIFKSTTTSSEEEKECKDNPPDDLKKTFHLEGMADTKFLDQVGENRDGTAAQKKTEGYKVPPPLLGYEKMELLDDAPVNRESEDMKSQDPTFSYSTPYVYTIESGILNQKLEKQRKDIKSSPQSYFYKSGSKMVIEELKNMTESRTSSLTSGAIQTDLCYKVPDKVQKDNQKRKMEHKYESIKQDKTWKHDYQDVNDQPRRKENEIQNAPTTLDLSNYMYEDDSSSDSETGFMIDSDIKQVENPSFVKSDKRKGAQFNKHQYEKLTFTSDSTLTSAPIPAKANDRSSGKKAKIEPQCKVPTAGKTSKCVQNVKAIDEENPKNKRKFRLEIPHKYEKVQHKKDVIIKSTNSSSEEEENQGIQHDGLKKTVTSKRMRETRHPYKNRNQTTSQLQIEGYRVPPPLLGYEKMELLDDSCVSRQPGDVEIQDPTFSYSTPYVYTIDNSILNQKLTKEGKDETSLPSHFQAATKGRNRKENQWKKTLELKPMYDCEKRYRKMTRGDKEITREDNKEITGESNAMRRRHKVINKDDSLNKEDGYKRPRPEGHYEEIKDDTD